jgi:hypothetical protein
LFGWWALVTTVSPALADAATLSVERGFLQSSQLPSPELIQTVGCEACRGPDLFGRIVGVAGGPGNTFAVVTAEAPFVRVWNRDAGTAIQFGRDGGGPGEMRRAVGVILTSASVQVGAASGVRKYIESFDAKGQHLASMPLSLSSPTTVLSSFQGSPSGRWGIVRDLDGRVFRVNLGTGMTEEIVRPPSLLDGAPPRDNTTLNIVSIAVSDDGSVAMGYGGTEYRLAIFPPGAGAPILGGRQVERIVRSAPSREEAERMRQEIKARLGQMDRPPPPEIIERMAAEAAAGARTVPYLSQTFDGALRFDAAGRLWARTPKGNFSGQTTFDVFDQRLNFLGEVVLPKTATFWHIGAERMVTAGVGDASIPVVRIWRLR